MLRLISIILCAIAIQAQTNQKPYRLLVDNGKLVISSGKILNHQTYVATQTATAASGSGGFALRVDQTNSLLATSMADFNSYFAGVTDADLFASPTAFATDRLNGSKGLQESVPAGGSRAAEYSYYVSTWAGETDTAETWNLVGSFGVPQKFFARPAVPLSELTSVEIESSAGALLSLTYYEGAPEAPVIASNSLEIAGGTIDDVSGFHAALAGWRNVSYTTFHQYDNDFTTNGVDPVTGAAWSIASGLHELTEDIILPFGYADPVDAAVWRFIATKEYY